MKVPLALRVALLLLGLAGAAGAAAQDLRAEEITRANVRETRRDYDRATKLPATLVEALTRTAVLGQAAWAEARKARDFRQFEPWLSKTVDLKKQEANCVGFTGHIYDALLDGVSLADVVVQGTEPGVDVIPSAIALAGAEVELAGSTGRERRLRDALTWLADRYDIVLIDCPPSLGLLTVNALTAADAVLIPLQCEYYALEGLTQLLATIDLVRDHLNPRLAIDGVVLTMADKRTNLSSEVEAEARRHLDGAVYRTIIPRSVRLSEAPSHGLSIAAYAPESKGGRAYAALAEEFRTRSAAGDRRGFSVYAPSREPEVVLS